MRGGGYGGATRQHVGGRGGRTTCEATGLKGVTDQYSGEMLRRDVKGGGAHVLVVWRRWL